MNVPKLRFSEFNDELKEYKIIDIMNIKNGLNKEKEEFGFGTPIVNYMDVNKKELIFSKNIKGLVNSNQKELETFRVKKGDIFFTRTSETSEEIGLSSSVMEDIKNCVFSGFILKATPKENILNPIFSGYYFRNPRMRNEIIKHSSITTRALTSGTLLSQMKIYIPSYHEQEKIGKTLYLLDKKIELQSKKIENLKLYTSNIFKTQINDISNFEKIGNIFIVKAGGDIKKENVSSVKTNEFCYPIFSNNLENNGLYGFSNEYQIDKPSITVTGRGEIGKAFVRNEKYYPIVRLLSLIPKRNMNLYFINEAINNINILKESTGVPQLTSPQISKYSIPFPDIGLQNKIGNFICTSQNKIELELIKLNRMKELKKGLMQSMFV